MGSRNIFFRFAYTVFLQKLLLKFKIETKITEGSKDSSVKIQYF